MEGERAPQMSFSEWQQNKEIIGERETRLPHQWPLYALSQLSEGKMSELNHHWLSVRGHTGVPPHSVQVRTLLTYTSYLKKQMETS